MCEITAASRAKSADDMLAVVRQNGTFLRSVDSYWEVEASLLRSLCGSSADTRAGIAVLAELPTAERRVTPAVALQRLQALESSAAMTLTPTGVQASVRFIIRHLENLNLGVTLAAQLDTCSSLVKRALQQFAFFLVVPVPGCKAKTILAGAAAFVVLHDLIADCLKKGHEVATSDLEKFQTYAWLAAPGSEDAVAEMVKKIVEAQGGSKKPKISAAAASVGGASSSTAPSKKSEGKSAAMRYFE